MSISRSIMDSHAVAPQGDDVWPMARSELLTWHGPRAARWLRMRLPDAVITLRKAECVVHVAVNGREGVVDLVHRTWTVDGATDAAPLGHDWDEGAAELVARALGAGPLVGGA